MSTYRDELFKATEANISDIKNQINELTEKLATFEKLKTSYMFAETDEDIRKVDDEIAHDKKIKEKAKRRQNKLREAEKTKEGSEKKDPNIHIRYRDNEYVLSKLRENFRKLANREKRNETGENVLDMKAHITYDSLHKEEIRMY